MAEKRRRLAEIHPAESIVLETADANSTEDGTVSKDKNQAQEETDREIKMEVESTSIPSPIPSCARTDAKPQNRDLQMKYDIAKNEDGPLKRTMKGSSTSGSHKSEKGATVNGGIWKGKQKAVGFELKGGYRADESDKDVATAERHPGLAARFGDVEAHLAVRYGEV